MPFLSIAILFDNMVQFKLRRPSIPDHTRAPVRPHRSTRIFVLRQKGIGQGDFFEVLTQLVMRSRLAWKPTE